jgi:hypothetical protein
MVEHAIIEFGAAHSALDLLVVSVRTESRTFGILFAGELRCTVESGTIAERWELAAPPAVGQTSAGDSDI